MTRIAAKIFSKGPFSAVRPYLGDSDTAVDDDAVISEPEDGFDSSGDMDASAEESAPALQESAQRSGLQVALGAFPQVVHLLVDPKEKTGENLSSQVGLPLVSLEKNSVDDLQSELVKPEYKDGFILEGFPTNAKDAEKLDGLLGNVEHQDRRVLGWELTDDAHQEVIDHYMDKDLLWMVPPSSEPTESGKAGKNVMSCLHGLPALQ